jgi:phosphoribosylglycinamide formyltransferase-1
MSLKKIVVLFSGKGGNLENIIKKLHKKEIDGILYEVSGAICNKKEAAGIQVCKDHHIPLTLIDHKDFNTREEFDKELVKALRIYNPDLTVLAGFMRILTPVFTDSVKSINLHPSLLPLFKGTNAIEKSFHSNMKVGGVSVHYVSSELDGGKIVLQECFKKEDDETLDSFTKKIKDTEYRILPQAIIKVLGD